MKRLAVENAILWLLAWFVIVLVTYVAWALML